MQLVGQFRSFFPMVLPPHPQAIHRQPEKLCKASISMRCLPVPKSAVLRTLRKNFLYLKLALRTTLPNPRSILPVKTRPLQRVRVHSAKQANYLRSVIRICLPTFFTSMDMLESSNLWMPAYAARIRICGISQNFGALTAKKSRRHQNDCRRISLTSC